MFKPFWNNTIKLNWQLGVLLIMLFGIPRFILVLNAYVTGRFNLVSLIFILMWVTPWILLNRNGRILIGIRKPREWYWLLPAFMIGVAACFLLYFIGKWLFFDTINNWFVYLSRAYPSPPGGFLAEDRLTYFIVFAVIGMTFSPIGEELLYRGLIHQCFIDKFGEHGASMLDSAAFAITHLAHFGIVFLAGRWLFLWFPAILWVLFMFLIGRIFYYMKIKTGSILGPIVSHAGFNMMMAYLMVYSVLI